MYLIMLKKCVNYISYNSKIKIMFLISQEKQYQNFLKKNKKKILF
jgi:hypothetical protein